MPGLCDAVAFFLRGAVIGGLGWDGGERQAAAKAPASAALKEWLLMRINSSWQKELEGLIAEDYAAAGIALQRVTAAFLFVS